jgi:hypothetical protein
VSANVSAGNVSATSYTGFSSNITSQYITTVATGTAPLVVSSTTQVANLNVATAGVAGTVTVAAQPNITSVGTLTSLSVTGNSNANRVFANFMDSTGMVTATQFTSNVATGTTPFVVASTSRVNNLNVAYANVADNINVAAGTGNNFIIFANAATGNVAETTSTGLIANLSNNSITATTFVGALSGAATSATTAGTVTTAAQPNITSTGTLTSLSVTGNISAGNVSATTFTGALSGAATSATTAGTVTTAAQPNITSVGTLTSLTSSGNITGANVKANAFMINGVTTGITAAGTQQSNATALTTSINIVTTTSSGTGVALPTAVGGMMVSVINAGGNSLAVYPAVNGVINSQSANVAYSLVAGGRLQFVAGNTTQWYTLGATYA